MEKFRGSIKNNRPIRNRKGQFAIESVLLMVILVGVFLAITNFTKRNKMLQKLVSEPMTNKIRTMVGFGTWKPDGCVATGKVTKQTLGKCHPNSIHRSLSSDPG